MKNKQGSVLIVALLFVMILAGWVAHDLSQSATEARAATLYNTSSRAFQLAEAGLDQAIVNLQTISGTDDIYTGSLGTGSFSIQEPMTVLSPLLYEASVVGTSNGVQRSLQAVLQVEPQSIFQYAVFGDINVTVSGDVRIDSYDSRNGPYDVLTNANGNGNIGTNSTTADAIKLSGNIHIDGQLSLGPGVAQPETVVEGFESYMVTAEPPVISGPEMTLPEVSVPEGLSCIDLSLSGQTTHTLSSPGVYCYNALSVGGGAVLTSDGPVVVYLKDSLSFSGESVIGVTTDPSQFTFLIAPDSSVDISPGAVSGSANIYAAMYGPNASFSISGDVHLYGSIVGRDATISGNVQFHYDEALADNNMLSAEAKVKLLSWQDQ